MRSSEYHLPMTRFVHSARKRQLRLLSTVLVVLTLLVNGLAVAYAAVPMVMHGCCPEMNGQAVSQTGEHCDHGKKNPGHSTTCDDQCLMRCASSTVVPSLAWMPVLGIRETSAPETATSLLQPFADSAPDLRPPILA